MNDEQLARLFRSLQTTDLPDPAFAEALFERLEGQVAQPRAERAGRPLWVLAAAALLLAALLGIALAVGSGLLRLPVLFVDTDPSSLRASAVAAGTIRVSGWREVDLAALRGVGGSAPVVWSGERFVLGFGPPTASRFTNDVEFLTSSDGQTWSLSPLSRGYPFAYAFDGTSGVAAGSDGEQAAVWTSPNSETWTRLPNPPALTLADNEVQLPLLAVVHGPGGYVALGNLSLASSGDLPADGPLLLWSPDGRDWQRETMEPFQHGTEPLPFLTLDQLVALQDRYVLAGRARGAQDASLWTSSDGRAWTQGPPMPGVDSVVAMAAGDAGAMLMGIESHEPPNCVAWRSVDGLTWTQMAAGCTEWSTSVVAAPFGFVAVTPTPHTFEGDPVTGPQFPCAGGLQVSPTGEEWTCVLPPDSARELVEVGSVAASATKVVIAGPAATGLALWVADVEVGS